METLNLNQLEPLLDVTRAETDFIARISILNSVVHFPMERRAWEEISWLVFDAIDNEKPGSDARRAALRLATKIPLHSVRWNLRDRVDEGLDPDIETLEKALDEVRDPSRMQAVLEKVKQGDSDSFAALAAMPVEEMAWDANKIPPAPADPNDNTHLWRALVLARLGDFTAIESIFNGSGAEPGLFFGSPFTAYAVIAAIRPIPDAMKNYFLDALDRFENSDTEKVVQLVAWAATGIKDAEGQAIDLQTAQPGIDQAASPAASRNRTSVERIMKLVREANARASRLPPEEPAEIVIGNQMLNDLPLSGVENSLPVSELALAQIEAKRPALDDGQMAWVLAHGRPPRVVSEMSGLIKKNTHSEARNRLLVLLSNVGDCFAGRAGSPGRGAGGGESAEILGRILIDEEPMEAMVASAPPATSAAEAFPASAPATEHFETAEGEEVESDEAEFAFMSDDLFESDEDSEPPLEEPLITEPLAEAVPAARNEQIEAENREVNVQLMQSGKQRNTFVAGADNVVRCWIGLPQKEIAAVSGEPIPWVDKIPKQGLPLTVQISYRGQHDSSELILPQSRTARTVDCDLTIHVPEDERYVFADLTFLYRGRIFECVSVEAFAIPEGEAEAPAQSVRVKAQVSRRDVIDLTERTEYDAAIVIEEKPAEAADTSPPNMQIKVFGSEENGRFDLSDSRSGIQWLNSKLFTTETSLVRRRAAGAAGRARLNAEDKETLELLRDMARQGAGLFNMLTSQGFRDPGKRIQLLNLAPKSYVPLEFVYDRGYPADEASLCDGWEDALLSDADECPVCSKHTLTDDERAWAPTICPLGFWSLQKIIERLDLHGPIAGNATPGAKRFLLPAFDEALFASSHRVDEADRDSVWHSLQNNFSRAFQADDWQQWLATLVTSNPQLLMVLPHHDVEAALDYLEIGEKNLPHNEGRLSRGQLTNRYVNPNGHNPGPIVFLLGCKTGTQTEGEYVNLTRTFQTLGTSIVVGTMAKILGRHAAPVATEFIKQLTAIEDAGIDFGTIMRRVRRRMLANGYLMSLCLVALGDADWHLTPKKHSP